MNPNASSGSVPAYVPIPVPQVEDSAFAHFETEQPTVIVESTAIVEGKRRTHRRLLLLWSGVAIAALVTLAVAIVSILPSLTPKGTLAIESAEPNLHLIVKKAGEPPVAVESARREIELAVDEGYSIELAEPRDGVRLVPSTFAIARNGRTVVKVLVDRPFGKPKPPPAVEVDLSPPDRRAAKWVLSVGGAVRVRGKTQDITEIQNLPEGDFELTIARLENNAKATDANLAVFQGCSHLRELKLEGSPVTDAGLKHFEACRELLVLGLTDTAVGDAGLAHLKDCTAMTIVNLAGTRVSDPGMKHFESCRNLREVWLYRTKVGDEGMKSFRQCPSLTRLDLTDTGIGDAGLKEIEKIASLRRLLLVQTKVTAAGIQSAKMAMPLCRIEWSGGVIEPMRK